MITDILVSLGIAVAIVLFYELISHFLLEGDE